MDERTREVFGECRSLLAQVPGTALFEQLTDVVGIVPDVEVVRYVQAHVSRWPARVWRVLPEDWILCGDVVETSALALCDTLLLGDTFYGTFSDELSGVLARWAPRRVVLEKDALRDEDFIALVASCLADRGAGLRGLVLRWLEEGWRTPSLEAFHALELDRLQELELRGLRLEDEALGELMGAAKIHALESLRLANNQLTSYGMREVFEYSWPGMLRWLDVRHNPIGVDGARVIAASAAVSELEWLQVSAHDVEEPGARSLAASQFLPLHVRRYWRGIGG